MLCSVVASPSQIVGNGDGQNETPLLRLFAAEDVPCHAETFFSRGGLHPENKKRQSQTDKAALAVRRVSKAFTDVTGAAIQNAARNLAVSSSSSQVPFSESVHHDDHGVQETYIKNFEKRHVISLTRTCLRKSNSDEHVVRRIGRMHTVAKAVCTSIKTMRIKELISNILWKSSEEHVLRAKLAISLQMSFHDKNWKKLRACLLAVRIQTFEVEKKLLRNGFLELLRQEIDVAVASLEQLLDATDAIAFAVEHLKDAAATMDTDSSRAKHQLKVCAQCVEQTASTFAMHFEKMWGAMSVLAIPISAKQNEKDAQAIQTERNTWACVLSDLPEELIVNVRDHIAAALPNDAEALQECAEDLLEFGIDPVVLPVALEAIRHQAWEANAAETLDCIRSGMESQVNEATSLMARVEEHLHIEAEQRMCQKLLRQQERRHSCLKRETVAETLARRASTRVVEQDKQHAAIAAKQHLFEDKVLQIQQQEVEMRDIVAEILEPPIDPTVSVSPVPPAAQPVDHIPQDDHSDKALQAERGEPEQQAHQAKQAQEAEHTNHVEPVEQLDKVRQPQQVDQVDQAQQVEKVEQVEQVLHVEQVEQVRQVHLELQQAEHIGQVNITALDGPEASVSLPPQSCSIPLIRVEKAISPDMPPSKPEAPVILAYPPRNSVSSGRRSFRKSADMPRLHFGNAFADTLPTLSGPPRLWTALTELRERVMAVWGSVEEAAKALAKCGGDIGGNGRISMIVLHAALQAAGCQRSCCELCVMFQALGLPCSVHATLSPIELCRLHDFEASITTDAAKKADLTLGFLEIRKALLDKMAGGLELLLTQVHVGLILANKAQQEVGEGRSKESGRGGFLAQALSTCKEALQSRSGTQMSELLLSQIGLRILVPVVASPVFSGFLRAEAAALIYDALVLRDRAGAPMLAHRPTRTPRANHIGLSQDETALFAAELWRPLLDVVNRENDKSPAPFSAVVLGAILRLFQQAQVPQVLLGENGSTLTEHVSAALQKLQQSTSADDLLAVVAAVEFLAKSRDEASDEGRFASDVHTLAAAFGGWGLLHERLSYLAPAKFGSETELGLRGAQVLQAWGGAKQKLLRLWPLASSKATGLEMIEALSKAIVQAEEEGFQTVWPQLSGLQHSNQVALNRNMPHAPLAPPRPVPKIKPGAFMETAREEFTRLNKFEESSVEVQLLNRLEGRWSMLQERKQARHPGPGSLSARAMPQPEGWAVMPWTVDEYKPPLSARLVLPKNHSGCNDRIQTTPRTSRITPLPPLG